MRETGLNALCDSKTQIMILGTFPSVKSRQGWYYHNPQNQFWQILSQLYDAQEIEPDASIQEDELLVARKHFLQSHNIGLWDIIDTCEIAGSDDNTIKNPHYNDLSILQRMCPNLKSIVFSSKRAFEHYQKYIRQTDKYPELNNKSYTDWSKHIVSKEILPSPSPAYAKMSFEDKKYHWAKILHPAFVQS